MYIVVKGSMAMAIATPLPSSVAKSFRGYDFSKTNGELRHRFFPGGKDILYM